MTISRLFARRCICVVGGSIAALLTPLLLLRGANLWDGGGADGNWSTALNWDDDLVPLFPQPLTFAGATNLITNNDLTGITVSGLTFDATADLFTLGGNAITLDGGIIDNSTTAQTINLPMAFATTQTLNVTAGGGLTIGPGANGSGVISGAGGLMKNGSGSLILGAMNTYTGNTVIDGGTLSFTANNLGLKGLIFGATAGGTNTSSLDLTSASVTATSLLVQTNNPVANPNTITIGAGQTLMITGATTLGYLTNGLASTTALTISGNGTLNATTTTNASFIISPAGANTNVNNTVTLDLSGLDHFIYSTGSGTGEFDFGVGARAGGTVKLARVDNTIIARSFRMGDSGGLNAGPTSTLSLGTGTNVIQADTVTVGNGKSSGIMNFQPGAGTLTIRNQAGTGRATINLGVGGSGSGAPAGTFSFNGHNVDILAGTLTMGNHNSGTTNATANLSFDTGTIDVTSISMASNSTGTGTSATATLTVDGTATLKTNTIGTGNFILANATTAGGTATGSFKIQGGLAQINSDITRGTGAGTINTTVSLSGGTLDMMNHNIGSAAAPIGTLTVTGGTLMNVNSINGTGGINMTGTGTLILEGTNNYSGPTVVSSGTLQVGTGGTTGTLGSGPVTTNGILAFNRNNAVTISGPIDGAGSLQQNGGGTLTLAGSNTYAGPTDINAGILSITGSLASDVNVNANGTLAGTGDGGSTGLVGNVTMSPGSSLRPGATGVDGEAGTLTLAGLTVLGGDFRFDLGAASDLVAVIGTAEFAAASTITPSPTAPAGTYTLLTAGSLLLDVAPVINAPTNTRKTFTSDFSTPNTIKLIVSGTSKSLNWTGATNGTWDVGGAGTQNWNAGVTADKFFNGDSVTFGDGPTNRSVVINTITVLPNLVTVNSSTGHDYTIGGTGGIGGAAMLVKSGTGALTLTGANTYSGGTTLNGGTLNINNPAALGTGALTIAGGAIDNTSGSPIAIAGNIAQNWNGDFTFTGSNNLDFGAGPVTLNADTNITVTAGTLTVGGQIGGTFVLSKSGNGALTLSGQNTNSGGTTLNAGTLNLNSSLALGAGAFTIAGGIIDNTSGGPVTLGGANPQNWNADLTFAGTNPLNLGNGPVTPSADRTVTVNASTLTVGGVIGGTFNLTKAGGGTLTLAGANTYTGSTTISTGTAVVTNAATGNSSLGSLSGGGVTILPGATLDLSGSTTAQALNFGTKQFTIAGTGVGGNGVIVNNGVSQFNTFQDIVLAGDATIGGSQRFDVRGTNATLDLGGHTLTKIGTNQFSIVGTTVSDGNIVVNQGLLSIESTTAIADFGTGTSITYNAGTTAQFFSNTATVSTVTRRMIFNGSGIQVGSDSNNNNSIISSPMTLNGDVSFVALGNTNNTSILTLTGNLTEAGGSRSITKTGASVLVLAGVNNWTGGTNVQNGTLRLASATALPNGARVTLGSGTTSGLLDLGGFDAAVNGLAVSGTGAANIVGNSSIVSPSTLTFAAGSSTFSGIIQDSANGGTQPVALAVTGGAFTLSGANTFTGGTTVSGGTLVVSGSLSGTSSVNVNAGTFRLGANNPLNDLASITLGNGTFDTGGFSDTTGNLTLDGTATLDLGTGASILNFADSSADSPTWTGTLRIADWSGSPFGGGTDQLFFGTSDSALTTDQIALITFADPFGPGSGNFGATLLPTGELVALPEPSAGYAVLAGLGLLAGRRRTLRSLQKTSN